MTLFRSGRFKLHSGTMTPWKIDCDALGDADLYTLSLMAASILPPYGEVEGVPTGGERFARQLRRHSKKGEMLLIADDVMTTGISMEKQRAGREANGIVIFLRGHRPPWVRALFRTNPFVL